MDIPDPPAFGPEKHTFPDNKGVQSIVNKHTKSQKASNYKLGYKKSFSPILSGTLLKKTLNTSWAERFFVLSSNRLIYYSDQSLKDMKGCFNLASLIEHQLNVKTIYPEIMLTVTLAATNESQKTLLTLNVAQKNLFQEWSVQIQKIVDRLRQLSFHQIRLFPIITKESILQNNTKLGISKGNFWNTLTISVSQLLLYGSHLDIILLRSKNPIFYFHRFFMRSYYDHVAVIIKDQTERLLVFQAIQSKGVCLSNLQSLITTFRDDYQQFGYRKLIVQKDTDFQIDKLEEYINVVLGSKYQLSLSKILLDNESEGEVKIEPKEGIIEEVRKQQKTYFCSELVADIYLKFGILKQGKSNNYWPKDFQQNELVLSKGFRLGPLIKVQFDDPPDSSDLSET